MQLGNDIASQLLSKDRKKAQNAAENIIDNKDIKAWECLLANEEYLFDFIKNKIGLNLLNAVNKTNINNLFEFLHLYSNYFADYIIQAFTKFRDEHIDEKFLTSLKNGTNEEKAYSAKYFGRIKDKTKAEQLFEVINTEDENLKLNIAQALGELEFEKAYNSFIENLNTEDDWKKIENAQLLSAYGKKEAFIPILKAMNTSAMAEYLAGEAVALQPLTNHFTSKDIEIKKLSLQAFNNIITGLAEQWPLSVIYNFDILNSTEALIKSAKNSYEGEEEDTFAGRYAQLLLKLKDKINLFTSNTEYTFDEEKNVKEELNRIHLLLNEQDELFWQIQTETIKTELEVNDENRITSALETINDYKFSNLYENVIVLINNNKVSEQVICKAILVLEHLGKLNEIENPEKIINQITDENIKIIVKNAFHK